MVPSNSSNQGQVIWVSHSKRCLKFITSLPSTHFTSLPLNSFVLWLMISDMEHYKVLCVLNCTHPTKQDRSTELCISSPSVRLCSEPQRAHKGTDIQPSVKAEGKFKATEILAERLKAIFQSVSTHLALFTTLVTFIRQTQAESGGNTSAPVQSTREAIFMPESIIQAFFFVCFHHDDWLVSKIL